jgi:uncharacterized membrane-anchored protein YitT (DUF2179 family)
MKQRVRSGIKAYILMTVGLCVYASGWVVFIIPNQIAGGGVIGIAAIIRYATGFPTDYSYLMINIGLLAAGTLIMGRGFGVKTLFGVGMAALLFHFLPEMITPEFIDKAVIHDNNLLNALIGGTLSGLGIGIVFMQGGSTGGTDIVAIVWSKFKNTSPGRVFMCCDLIIIGSILLLPGKSFEHVIYGYIEMVSFSYVIDLVLSGNKQSVQIMVFSQQYEILADRLVQDLHRGVTVLDSMGWYTKKESKVIVIVARKNETNNIYRIIKETDPQAFITVANVMGVFGKGFEQIKTGKIAWNNKAIKKSGTP